MMTTDKVTGVRALTIAGVCLLMGLGRATAATVNSDGTAWSEDPERSTVTLTVNGSVLTVNIISLAEWATRPSSDKAPRSAVVLVDAGVPDSPFSGNLLDAAVRGLSFQIASTCAQADLRQSNTYVFLRGASGREWRTTFTVAAGQVLPNTVLLDYAAWTSAYLPKPDYNAWLEDLKDVVEVGIRLTPGGTVASANAQSFTVSAFHLVGDGGVIGPAATLTAGQRGGLLNRFGVQQFENVVTDRGVDTDGDGVTDYHEIMVGTQWDNGNDKFASKIAASPDGVALRWSCNAGRYNVLRADGDINAGFTKISIDGVVDIEPTAAEEAAGVMQRVDAGATGNGPFFYRVERIGNK
jgi:hypothetical protein